jgi:hypothetical protein
MPFARIERAACTSHFRLFGGRRKRIEFMFWRFEKSRFCTVLLYARRAAHGFLAEYGG